MSALSRRCMVAVACVCVCAALPARAVDVGWLLDSEVPVESRTAGDQKVALQDALHGVLVRITGRTDVGTSVALSNAFADPAPLTARMGVVETPQGDMLRVTFDRSMIVALLNRANLPVWSTRRPQLMIWMVQQDDFGESFVAGGGTHPLQQALQREARRRGVPIVFPLMDLDDSSTVSVGDVTGHFDTALVRAGIRYGGEATMAGVFSERFDGGYLADWRLLQGTGDRIFTLETNSAEDMARLLLDGVIPALRGDGAGAEGFSGDGYRVIVHGIDSMRAYAGTIDALSTLDGVDGMVLDQFEGDSLTLRVSSLAPYDALMRSISITRHLRAEFGDVVGIGLSRTIQLRWWPEPPQTESRLLPTGDDSILTDSNPRRLPNATTEH